MVNDGYKDQAVEKLGDHRPAAHWRGHKYTPYEGGHRVPCIAVWPAGITANRKSHAMLSLVDLGATLTALVNETMTLPKGALPDSFDQSKVFLYDDNYAVRTAVIAQNYQLNIRDKQWKYIVPRAEGDNPKGGRNPLNGELYNLEIDPAETNNVAKDNPERSRAMYNAILTAIRNGYTRPDYAPVNHP
jgi:arylsulfatase A-like enzyme